MATISAAMVKELRDKTGAGMMDCKKALAEADGNVELAIENLRKAGAIKAANRAGKATNEGRMIALIEGGVAVLAEVLCETDFVAKNEKFEAYGKAMAKRVATELTSEGIVSEEAAENEKEHLVDLVTVIGENLQIGRVARWVPQGKAANYIHLGGKLGVLVDVKGDVDDEYLNNLCLHIAAFNPTYLRPDDVPADVVEKEKEIAAAQPDLANKPANIIDKIVMGKINKWYSEVCLVKQGWVRDDKTAVEKVNPKAQIVRFVRWQVGQE